MEEQMKRPEMILFDYGHTLLYEPGFDALRCEEAAYPYIVENPLRLSAKQIYVEVQKLFQRFQKERDNGIEIHQWQFMRLAYEYLGLTFSISNEELEEIEWTAASPGAVMPKAEKILAYLEEAGIRTGVISNIGWSGQALATRINRLLPNNRFEFIMASSEYAVRKPDRLLFETALRKAGLLPEQVWYCGDSIRADVFGAQGAGIYPVLYEGSAPYDENPFAHQNDGVAAAFDYLHIYDWDELIGVLEACEGFEISVEEYEKAKRQIAEWQEEDHNLFTGIGQEG
ncbi:MAG: HAD family hydrolase [Lachnospiraceae bacterium]|nr:HAD family hydrolase [Lachnospiraceae bacterium]